MIECPECKENISNSTYLCTNCGYLNDVDFRNRHIQEFEVTETHGITAFQCLSSAQNNLMQRNRIKSSLSGLTNRQIINSVSESLEISSLERNIYKLLSASIILYQASMESILSLAEHLEPELKINKSGFRSKWIYALEKYDAPVKEFKLYHKCFYKEMRIPLTHLHPKTENYLEKINKITFQKVYSGIRNGWWAYSYLLNGIKAVSTKPSESWQIICNRVDLKPDLFFKNHPVNSD